MACLLSLIWCGAELAACCGFGLLLPADGGAGPRPAMVWDSCVAWGCQGFSCCLSHSDIVSQGLGGAVPKWTQPG